MFSLILEVITLVYHDHFLFGVTIFVVLFFLKLKFGIVFFNVVESDSLNSFSENTTHCSDKNCVRCCKYRTILKIATERIKDLNENTTIERITSSLQNDIPVDTKDASVQNPNVFLYNELSGKAIWNLNELNSDTQNDIFKLEHSWNTIVKEFKTIYTERHIQHWKRNSTESGSWDVFHIVNQGMLVEDNVKLCPKTGEIVQGLTTAMVNNVFGNVVFSVVKPSTVISPHYGPTNIRLRCHLGLISNSRCTLQVGQDQAVWEKGRCLVFDDSYLHSVDHSGSRTEHLDGEDFQWKGSMFDPGDRAVLIVDIWHPDISIQEKEILNYLFSPA